MYAIKDFPKQLQGGGYKKNRVRRHYRERYSVKEELGKEVNGDPSMELFTIIYYYSISHVDNRMQTNLIYVERRE